MKIYKAILAVATAAVLTCCTSDESGMDDYTPKTPNKATEWIDSQLSKYYLYNSEYNAMTRDKSLEYDNFLTTHLMKMNSNIYDKKLHSDEDGSQYYSLFSYVDRTPASKSRFGTESISGYGFASLLPAYYTENNVTKYCIVPLTIFPDSPAIKAGIKRGDYIISVGGTAITRYNIESLYNELLAPTSASTTLQTTDGGRVTLTAESVRCNPVIKSDLLDLDGNGTKETGYLAYYSFDNIFRSELLAELMHFSSAYIEHIILDLRENLGGYTSLAAELSSAIVGIDNSNTKLYYYRFNPTITATKYRSGMRFDSSNEKFYSYAPNMNTYRLTNIAKRGGIYCLVNYNTASSSEMTISCLEGLDYEVTLIGERTRGKNVGMYLLERQIDDYDYTLAPITFETTNAKDEGGYYNGMSVDHSVEDSYYELCSDDDAPFIRAKELINGTYNPQISHTRSATPARHITPIGGSIHSETSPRGSLELVEE